jgi:hypothetical protein
MIEEVTDGVDAKFLQEEGFPWADALDVLGGPLEDVNGRGPWGRLALGRGKASGTEWRADSGLRLYVSVVSHV